NKTIQEITTADSNDPAKKVGYAFAWVDTPEFAKPAESFELKPGQEIKMGRVLIVGQSPAEAFGRVARIIKPTVTFKGKMQEIGGGAIASGKLDVKIGEEILTAYPDENGEFELYLPVGEYDVTATDAGRPPVEIELTVYENETQEASIDMQPASSFVFDIRGEDGNSIPCKAQFIGADGTDSPYLGPKVRAHGCFDQYHSETGRFTVQVPPGTYNVVVTRGIEFSHIQKKVTLKAGEAFAIEGTLRRMVDTTGWVSADFHNHSSPSGDNVCPTHDRIINLAAEHVEFAPTTEHNRIFDWTPYIDDLGLSKEMYTIPGIELTGSGAHFNSFPFKPVPRTQDGGAPVWQQDPRLNAIVLRDYQGQNPDRWVQVNHPDMIQDFIDRNGDGMADGGFKGLESLIDGAETWGPNTYDHNILTKAPYRIYKTSNDEERLYFQRQFIWLQLLNLGHRYISVAVSDAHSVYGNGVGGWRTYIPSSTDAPAEIDWKEIVRNAKAGQVVITNGPFLEVKTLDGVIAGGSTRAVGSLPVSVKVQCNSWIDVDRVQILVNSRQREDLNFTRESHPGMFSDGVVKFDQTIDVPLSEDSHIIVVAYGENFTLKTGYGSDWQAKMNPCAYTNPIYVDVDGGGFQP
ncbi:CehA/McbA family metallohydrolase, partial [bacterium]|nr:CehA/McbA family metallohydrolase [bacterium]